MGVGVGALPKNKSRHYAIYRRFLGVVGVVGVTFSFFSSQIADGYDRDAIHKRFSAENKMFEIPLPYSQNP